MVGIAYESPYHRSSLFFISHRISFDVKMLSYHDLHRTERILSANEESESYPKGDAL